MRLGGDAHVGMLRMNHSVDACASRTIYKDDSSLALETDE
jgi:hypothetical protein